MKIAVLLDQSGYASQVVDTVIEGVAHYKDMEIEFMYLVKSKTDHLQEEGNGYLARAKDKKIKAAMDFVTNDSIKGACKYVCEKVKEQGVPTILIPDSMEEVYQEVKRTCSDIPLDRVQVFPRIMEVMTGDPPMATPEMTAFDVSSIMAEKKVDGVIITEDKVPVGIITKTDLVAKVMAQDKDPKNLTCEDIMSKPLIAIAAGDDISLASKLMAENNIRTLPVVESQILVGTLTVTDLAIKFPAIAKNIIDGVSKKSVVGSLDRKKGYYDFL